MQKIDITEESLKIFKNLATCVNAPSGTYIYLPYWFQLFEKDRQVLPVNFDKLPADLKETIESARKFNPAEVHSLIQKNIEPLPESELGLIQKMIAEKTAEISSMKDSLIRKKIIEKIPAEEFSTIEEEMQRTFPRIICKETILTGIENWYWNDGTKEGLLLIRFFPIKPNFSYENNSFKLSAELKYE